MSSPVQLTFLIPTHNRARLLARAVNSVLDQATVATIGFEIIIVDDGSSDGTPEVVSAWAGEPRVRVLRHAPNRGVAFARNVGLRVATGTWTVLLDSDNRLLDGALERLSAVASSIPDDVVVIWGRSVASDGRSMLSHRESGLFDGKEMISGRFEGEHFSVVRTDVARRHLFAELGTRNECAACFWIPMFLDGRTFITQEAFQEYETSGDDRVTALNRRLSGALELVTCFREVLSRHGEMLKRDAPERYWSLWARVAMYETAGGNWARGVTAAVRGLAGLRHVPGNVLVALACAPGPAAARTALRFRSRS